MISPYLCTDSHGENLILLVPVYSAETRPIGEIGCDDGISSLDIGTVDTFTIGRSDADSPGGMVYHPPSALRSCGLRYRSRTSRSLKSFFSLAWLDVQIEVRWYRTCVVSRVQLGLGHHKC